MIYFFVVSFKKLLGSLDIMAFFFCLRKTLSLCSCHHGAWDWGRLKQGHRLAVPEAPTRTLEVQTLRLGPAR